MAISRVHVFAAAASVLSAAALVTVAGTQVVAQSPVTQVAASTSCVTDAAGYCTVPHTLGAVPSAVVVTAQIPAGWSPYTLTLVRDSKTAQSFKVRAMFAAGQPKTKSTVWLDYVAMGGGSTPPTTTTQPTALPPTTTATPTTVPPSTTSTALPTTTTPPPAAGLAGPDNTGHRTAVSSAQQCGTITTPGTVLQGRTCSDYVHVNADGVVIRDSVFLNGLIVEDPADNVLVEWVTIHDGMSIASSRDVTVRNVEVDQDASAIQVTSDRGFKAARVVIDTVWTHSPNAVLPTHVDGIHVRGVDTLTIRNSRIDMGPFVSSHTAALYLENANGGNTGVVTVTGNYLDGGGYTFRAHAGGTPNLTLTGNRFGPNAYWGAECLLTNDGVTVTPVRSVDNLRQADGQQARGCPIIP